MAIAPRPCGYDQGLAIGGPFRAGCGPDALSDTLRLSDGLAIGADCEYVEHTPERVDSADEEDMLAVGRKSRGVIPQVLGGVDKHAVLSGFDRDHTQQPAVGFDPKT